MKIACVAAHQDDEMHCLGTLIKYRRLGHDIVFICVTNGDKGMSWDPETSFAEAAAVREREMRTVAAALDADYHCLGRTDGFLYDDEQVRLDLIDALRRFEVDVFFTHWASDYITDHTWTCQIALQAALYVQIASVRTEHPALGNVPVVFHMNPGDGYGFEPTHFVELPADVHAEKLRILRLHESQMAVLREVRGYDYGDVVEAHDRRQGARVLRPYAESFRPCLFERRTPLANVLP